MSWIELTWGLIGRAYVSCLIEVWPIQGSLLLPSLLYDLRHFFVISSREVKWMSLSRVRLFATPRTATHQASLSITNSWSPPKPMSIELVMPSNHLFLCHPLLLPSVFPSIRVFSNESALRIGQSKLLGTTQVMCYSIWNLSRSLLQG